MLCKTFQIVLLMTSCKNVLGRLLKNLEGLAPPMLRLVYTISTFSYFEGKTIIY